MNLFFSLPQATILNVTGRDCVRYLNARLTNDIKALKVGSGCLAAALTPQGKTQALFQVLRLGETEYLLIADNGSRSEIVTALKRFIVADKVIVTDLSETYRLMHVIASKPEELDLTSPLPIQLLDGGRRGGSSFIQQQRRSETNGFDLVLTEPESLELTRNLLTKQFSQASPEHIEFLRLQAGILCFPVELNEQSLFPESGMRQAVSFTKGCYAGQEVVEKVDAIGKTAKRIRVIKFNRVLDSLKPACDLLTADGSAIGKTLAVASDSIAQLTYCSAILKNSALSEVGSIVQFDHQSGEIFA